ncbi:MAG: hypothetical protein AB8I08_05290 [Sandaracinaceae bacterium]
MLVVFGDSHTIALREGFQRLRGIAQLRPASMLKRAVATWEPAARIVERHPKAIAAAESIVRRARSLRPAPTPTPKDLAREFDIRVGQIDHGYTFHRPFFRVDAKGLHFTRPAAANFFRKLVAPSPAHIERRDARRFVICSGFYPSSALLSKFWQSHSTAHNTEGRHYLSRGAYHALVRDYTAPLLRFLVTLQDLQVDVSVVASPPMSPNGLLSWKTASFGIEEVNTVHDEFRNAFAAELGRRGIPYTLPPPEVYGADGLLRQELASTRKVNDYHANAKYGEAMVAHLLEDLAARGVFSTP